MCADSVYRWSDNDTRFGPFIYAPDKYRFLTFVLGSGYGEEYTGCRLRICALGRALILSLPPIILPFSEKVFVPEWRTNGTMERLGRDWYWNKVEREYGFSYDRGFLTISFGAQTSSPTTRKCWSCLMPWKDWKPVRLSIYDLSGQLFATKYKDSFVVASADGQSKYELWSAVEASCPVRSFFFKNFDGEELTAKTRIEEREWRLGNGWFKWLSLFHKPSIIRSLNIEFSGEMGKQKGSGKGGTTEHYIEMLDGELHESAFRRYCSKHEMNFIEKA